MPTNRSLPAAVAVALAVLTGVGAGLPRAGGGGGAVAPRTGDAGATGVVEVTVVVDGLACPFCAYALEKNLRRLRGVSGVRIDVDAGLATLGADAAARPCVRAVADAVREAGFTPGRITLLVAGRVERAGTGLAIVDGAGGVVATIEDSTAMVQAGDVGRFTGELVAAATGRGEAPPAGGAAVSDVSTGGDCRTEGGAWRAPVLRSVRPVPEGAR